jgi:hypothetical protein
MVKPDRLQHLRRSLLKSFILTINSPAKKIKKKEGKIQKKEKKIRKERNREV